MMRKQRKPNIKILFETHHFIRKGTYRQFDIVFFLLMWKQNHQNQLIEIHKINSDSSNTKKNISASKSRKEIVLVNNIISTKQNPYQK